jgi:hypothetical protein
METIKRLFTKKNNRLVKTVKLPTGVVCYQYANGNIDVKDER